MQIKTIENYTAQANELLDRLKSEFQNLEVSRLETNVLSPTQVEVKALISRPKGKQVTRQSYARQGYRSITRSSGKMFRLGCELWICDAHSDKENGAPNWDDQIGVYVTIITAI